MIQCAQYQTHENREILILADGRDVADLVPNDGIRYYYQSEFVTIGAKRNAGCELARGELICMFDDDDWSGPERLASQIARLRETGKSVTGYRTMRFTNGSDWWRYDGEQGYALGTSLCFLRTWWMGNRFPANQVGEDAGFVKRAHEQGVLSVAEAGELMFATIHGGNSCPRNVLGSKWTRL